MKHIYGRSCFDFDMEDCGGPYFFLKAWISAGKFASPTKLATYINTVAFEGCDSCPPEQQVAVRGQEYRASNLRQVATSSDNTLR